ncbi:MAG TPA: ribbon-helix-helix domain-containing protein [Allosphingosinicella sp.]|nr:ribbon-helix-helix domain-containing protein [Allosphingosinicella sp.]
MSVRPTGPIKRSVTIAGHATSISLEPLFWTALREAAAEDKLPLNALVARIDGERVMRRDPPNLASAIRLWLFERARARTVSTER